MNRGSFSVRDNLLGRSVEGEDPGGVVLLTAAGNVFLGSSPEAAFRMLVELARTLTTSLPPGPEWQACYRVVAYGEAAAAHRPPPAARSITTASDVLEIVREELGADAWDRVRTASVDVMMGRRKIKR